MQETFSDCLRRQPPKKWKSQNLLIRPIQDEEDLWYATVECRIYPEQEGNVNPAGFSIGRAYLNPQDHVPCVICLPNGDRIGYIVFRKWAGEGRAYSWSYFIDRTYQRMGYGKAAALLAIGLLKSVDSYMPIKLSTELYNEKAQRLYESVGFQRTDEFDGDDLVYMI